MGLLRRLREWLNAPVDDHPRGINVNLMDAVQSEIKFTRLDPQLLAGAERLAPKQPKGHDE